MVQHLGSRGRLGYSADPNPPRSLSGYLFSCIQRDLGGHTVNCKALFYQPREV